MINSELVPILQILDGIRNLGLLSEKKWASVQKIKHAKDIEVVLNVLKQGFVRDLAGYFQNHRSSSQYASIDNEYKVQDLIYCMLRPIVKDLQFENPQSKAKGALSSVRVDFSSKNMATLLEIKYVDSVSKARTVETEISEDIVKYGRSRKFNVLIFFIYCNGYAYPSKSEFEIGLTSEQNINKNKFHTFCIIN